MKRAQRTAKLIEALADMRHVYLALAPEPLEECQGAHVRVIEHDDAIPSYYLRVGGSSNGGPRVWSREPLIVIEVFHHNRDERFAHEVYIACELARDAIARIRWGRALLGRERSRRALEKRERRTVKRWGTREERQAYGSRAWLVKQRFGDACVYCGAPGPESVDHIHPRIRGGKDEHDNLVPACLPCNHLKGEMSAGDFLELLESRRQGAAFDVLERLAEVLERSPEHA